MTAFHELAGTAEHQSGIAEVLIREMEALSRKTSLTKTVKADILGTIVT